jgi:serine beta-lactamase-like protein LACTB, mitochondrial
MKSWNRTETWVALIVGAIGLVLAAILGLPAYMSATATPWHPDPQGIPAVTQPSPSPRWAAAVEEARRAVRAGLVEQNLPGYSVAVGVGGELVWAEGVGWADVENRVPVTPTLRFRIGTASKALTSAAVGLLLDQGRLALDDDIRTHVPEFPEQPWPVTLRHLMGHLAGVRNDGGDEGPLFGERCERPVDALPFFADRPLLFEPGTNYRYSSYGWILVSAAVDASAREPFLSFIREGVFEPLGMHHTEPESADPLPDRATFYFPRFAADPRYGLHLMRDIDLSCYSGASVFLSTPSDLVRFGMAINGGTLLEPATVERLQTSQRLPSGEETGYGLGWDIETVSLSGAPTRLVGHDGAVLGGPVASLLTIPDRGIVVAVTSNISYADASAVAQRIAEAFVAPRRDPARE